MVAKSKLPWDGETRPRITNMGTNGAGSPRKKHWESAHLCPGCGFVINLAEIDLRAITTGILLCSRCEWSGQIEIQIVDETGAPP